MIDRVFSRQYRHLKMSNLDIFEDRTVDHGLDYSLLDREHCMESQMRQSQSEQLPCDINEIEVITAVSEPAIILPDPVLIRGSGSMTL